MEKPLIDDRKNYIVNVSPYQLEKTLRDASICHRLGKSYEGPCKVLHGHNYSFKVRVETGGLDKYDMGLDFNMFKKMDEWIQTHWDHGVLVSKQDVTFLRFLEEEGQKFYRLDNEGPTQYCNTTVEIMCDHLLKVFTDILNELTIDSVSLTVTIWETKSSSCSRSVYYT